MFMLPVEGYGYFLESAKEQYRHENFLTYYDKIRCDICKCLKIGEGI